MSGFLDYLKNRLRNLQSGKPTPRPTPFERATQPKPIKPERTEPAAKPAPAAPQFVIVGIDFGTSGTKAAFRDILAKDKAVRVVDFGTSSPGFCRFSLPSTVAVGKDRILIGDAARGQSVERFRTFQSPKMALLKTASSSDGLNPDLAPDYPGWRSVHTWPEFLASVYLANVLQRVMEHVRQEFPALLDKDLQYNLDAPITDFSGDLAAPAFARAYGAAVRLAADSDLSGSPEDLWTDWLRARRSYTVLPESERRSFVIPEAQAIIQGSSELSDLHSPEYKAVIDVGAGTTNVAFFKLVNEKGKGRKLYFFAAGTKGIGCNDMDWEFIRFTCEDAGVELSSRVRDRSLDIVRQIKARLVRGEPVGARSNGTMLKFDPEVFADCCWLLSEQPFTHYKKVCGKAYAKHKDSNEWTSLSVILAGGGSRLPGIKKRFSVGPKTFVKKVEELPLKTTGTVRVLGDSNLAPQADETPFLLTVLGLVTPVPQMPQPVDPDNISDWEVDVSVSSLYAWEAPDEVG